MASSGPPQFIPGGMSLSAFTIAVDRRRPTLTPFQILSYLVLAIAAIVIVVAFFSGPAIFAQVLVIGLSNGALYALIALGYTMVYGIIELINFAHGDLFMIGSVLAAIILEEKLGYTESVSEGMVHAVRRRRRGHGAVRVVQRHHRATRVSPTAQRTEVGAIDHRRRCQLHPAELRHLDERLGAELAYQRAAAVVDLDRQHRDPHQVPRRDRASPFRC